MKSFWGVVSVLFLSLVLVVKLFFVPEGIEIASLEWLCLGGGILGVALFGMGWLLRNGEEGWQCNAAATLLISGLALIGIIALVALLALLVKSWVLTYLFVLAIATIIAILAFGPVLFVIVCLIESTLG